MAELNTIKGALIQVLIGDGASPVETFTHKCMINTSRGISWSSSSTQTPVVDCDNPESPAWLETDIDGLSCTIEGSGRINVGDEEFFDDWFVSGESKNVKFKQNKTGGSIWTGAFKLSQWSLSAADRLEKGEASVTLMSTGTVTRADV